MLTIYAVSANMKTTFRLPCTVVGLRRHESVDWRKMVARDNNETSLKRSILNLLRIHCRF